MHTSSHIWNLFLGYQSLGPPLPCFIPGIRDDWSAPHSAVFRLSGCRSCRIHTRSSKKMTLNTTTMASKTASTVVDTRYSKKYRELNEMSQVGPLNPIGHMQVALAPPHKPKLLHEQEGIVVAVTHTPLPALFFAIMKSSPGFRGAADADMPHSCLGMFGDCPWSG